MADKRRVIREYLTRYNLRTMIETGLYNGHGSGEEMLDLLDRLIVIDTQAANCDQARALGITEVWCGDSGDLMPHVLHGVNEPALFWLDAHEWVGPEFGENPKSSPLLAELDAIKAWPFARQSVILIDDVRQFADSPLAQPGWPSTAEIGAHRPLSAVAEWSDDILRLTPS